MQPEIIFDHVTFTYSGSKKPAIKNINLKIMRGETILIVGPAGAGKSTLCYCIM
ncbi:MAG: ATP-binding cassette domain-containing protein [Nitrososphaeria archaeon]